MVTGPITLSATLSSTASAQIPGNEPTNGYTNNTLDLALLGAPAIQIIKEVCDPTAGDCDAGADLGGDGWDDVSYDADFLEDITWRITVTNTGWQTLTDVKVNDPLVAACATPVAFTPPASLTPGSSFSYTCETPDLIVGFVNTADVEGTGPTGTKVTEETSPETAKIQAEVTTPDPNPGIMVKKYVVNIAYPADEHDAQTAPGLYVPVGDTVTWVYDVRLADGKRVPLKDVTLTDDGGPNPSFSGTYLSGDTNGNNLLEYGETWRFTTTSQLVVTAGQYTNVATAQGTPVTPEAEPISATDPANHYGVQA
ncbi:MAG TPA: hypothetical protein PLV68_05095, partial [Ilumatobacteraceae bacterium]|nr:hypothetical protein [Ilumatobacteraceae bacterium]